MLKGTPMQIWKSVNILVLIWKYDVKDFTLFYYLRHAKVKDVKSLFTNIQKQ